MISAFVTGMQMQHAVKLSLQQASGEGALQMLSLRCRRNLYVQPCILLVNLSLPQHGP